MTDRVTELEIQLAHAQRLFDQLNEVVTSQATELDRVRQRLKTLEDLAKELKRKSESIEEMSDEKPPHY